MTAHELARLLLAGPDRPVHFAYTDGDYWRTTVAPEVTGAGEGSVTESAYHGKPMVAGEDEEGARRVIVLSGRLRCWA